MTGEDLVRRLPQGRNVDEWQVAVWNLPDEDLTRPQKFQFMLMLEHAFNTFDPFRVVSDLLRHRAMWEGAIMDRAYPGHPDDPFPMWTDLIKLRDVGRGVWNVDTLFILTPHSQAEWAPIMEEWDSDVYCIDGTEVDRILGSGRRAGTVRILASWWD